MKSWALAAIFVSAAALAACEGTSDGDGSGGGGGEGGSTGTTTTTTGTETGTTTTSTTGEGCAAEDTAMNCGDVSMGCTACALNGPCSAEYMAFLGDPNAQALLDCYNPCMDNACFEACDAMYQTAADLYLEMASCVACENCFTACDGASLGCQ